MWALPDITCGQRTYCLGPMCVDTAACVVRWISTEVQLNGAQNHCALHDHSGSRRGRASSWSANRDGNLSPMVLKQGCADLLIPEVRTVASGRRGRAFDADCGRALRQLAHGARIMQVFDRTICDSFSQVPAEWTRGTADRHLQKFEREWQGTAWYFYEITQTRQGAMRGTRHSSATARERPLAVSPRAGPRNSRGNSAPVTLIE